MKLERINTLLSLSEELREMHPDFTMTMLSTFLEVARGQGMSGRHIEKALGTNHTTANRLLKYFDDVPTNKREEMRMFSLDVDPMDYRAKVRKLNARGEKFAKHIDEKLQAAWG